MRKCQHQIRGKLFSCCCNCSEWATLPSWFGLPWLDRFIVSSACEIKLNKSWNETITISVFLVVRSLKAFFRRGYCILYYTSNISYLLFCCLFVPIWYKFKSSWTNELIKDEPFVLDRLDYNPPSCIIWLYVRFSRVRLTFFFFFT